MKMLLKLSLIFSAIVMLTILNSNALAKHGPGGPQGFKNPHGFSHGVKGGWQSQGLPPGFVKGEKKGWHGQPVPPGWEKTNWRNDWNPNWQWYKPWYNPDWYRWENGWFHY